MDTVTGLWRLVRFIVRRDRVRLVVWVLGLVAFVVVSAASLPPVYPDQASIDSYAGLMGDNPAIIAFTGPGYGFDDPKIGNILVNEIQLWACVSMALMSIFLVNRSTRAEEDVERADLIRSTVVGRYAPLAATLTVVACTNLLVGILSALGFVAFGYELIGSVALAASFVAVGLVFAAVAAVSVQVASTGRAALGGAGAALAGAFIVRAVGDIAGNALRWLSPIGWAQSVRAFAGERWTVLLLCIVATEVLVVAAFELSTRRDLGSGLIPERPGPPEASRILTHPTGLALRLQRGALIGWSAGLLLTGIVYGSIGDDVEQMIEDNPAYADLIVQAGGGNLVDSFFTTALVMLALLVTGFAISSVLRLRTEETAGRAESILAAPMGRTRWVMSHLTIAVLGAIGVVAAGGLGIGLSYAVVSGETEQVWRLLAASLTTIPAVLVLLAAAAALFGWTPRASIGAWAVLGVTAVIELFGELLRLPHWMRLVSPFGHLPGLPAAELRLLPVCLLLATAAALTGIALAGFARRDLTTE